MNCSMIARYFLASLAILAHFLGAEGGHVPPWMSFARTFGAGGLLLALPLPCDQWVLDSLFNLWYILDGDENPSRVLRQYLPLGEECTPKIDHQPIDGRRGICMNTYQCRYNRGKSYGQCAYGVGVCCIITATCGEEVRSNLTYVTSPGFPNLIERAMNCSIAVRKINRQVSQLRIDFVHFNIGQPNRRTGVCDRDALNIRNNRTSLRLCGWNSGQHVYIDVNDNDQPIELDFLLPGNLDSRIWEMRVIQLGFEDRAPAGCLQYFREPSGSLRTMNYLTNGRFLAEQDYLVCIRQESGMCGISYTPCSPDSFRIGPSRFQNGTNGAGVNMNLASMANNSIDQQDADIEGSGADMPDDNVIVPADMFASAGPVVSTRCRDRILIPCDFEEFITPGNNGVGICNLEHCGDSLCDQNEMQPNGTCRIETWVTPFRVRIAFGPGRDNGTPLEDNTGMCILYEQQACAP